jgi:DNA-binding MarR family transcriptional regulator
MDRDPLARTELTFLLGLAFQVMLAEFIDRVDAAGYAELRPMHGLVFQAIGSADLTSSELAERLGVTKQAAGQMVDELERLGYVERRPHPAGGRRRLLALTGKARDHLRVAGQIMHDLESELAGQLDEAALAALRGTLARVIRSRAGANVPPLRPIW